MATKSKASDGHLSSMRRAIAGAAKGATGKRLKAFAETYFAQVPAEELAGLSGADLAAMVKSHLKTGATRKRGKTMVRAYTPDPKRDGWASNHSVIEIVTDDMPFLVDSVSAELTRREVPIHLVIHPICQVVRNKSGAITDFLERGHAHAEAQAESFMHFQIMQQSAEDLIEIAFAVTEALKNVRAAVEDWRPMRERMEEIIDELAATPKGVTEEESEEGRELLRWLHDNHYTFLGFREYKISASGKKKQISVVRDSGLGVLRDPSLSVLEDASGGGSDAADLMSRQRLLTITKTSHRSTVHRSVHMDAVVVSRYDAKGRIVGQCLFVGLFTSVAYNLSPRSIPLLRRRIRNVVDRAGYSPDSHDGKALVNILESYPRDELFQISEDDLFDIATGILYLQERQRVALFVREDPFRRYLSCLVFVPRDRYDTALRRRIQEILAAGFKGQPAAFFTQLGDSPLARVHLIITLPDHKIPKFDQEALEAEIAEATRSWADKILEALVARDGEGPANKLFNRFKTAFGPSYQALYDSDEVLFDIDKIAAISATGGIGFNLYRPSAAPDDTVRFKLYSPDQQIPLSDVLPVFEHMGFKVINEAGPHMVDVPGAGFSHLIVHDFGLQSRAGVAMRSSKKGSPATNYSSRVFWISPTTSSANRSRNARMLFAWTMTIPISSSQRTRERQPSRISPMVFQSTTATGSATRLRRAAARATTTKRWALPRAVPGSRSNAISAKWEPIRSPRTSPASGSAICPATCSATVCCCRSTSNCRRPSTTCISSWIPIRIQHRLGLSANVCSTWAAHLGRTTTRRRCPRAATSMTAMRNL